MAYGNIENHVRFERGDVPIPDSVRKLNMDIIRELPRDMWPTLRQLLMITPNCCTPLALLREAVKEGTAVVGKLGFADPQHPDAPMTDWEFGETGVYFGTKE
tara:strand:- start:207 stop:512 length:306 start_codon:yes stop_codon:yes gene_type:complete